MRTEIKLLSIQSALPEYEKRVLMYVRIDREGCRLLFGCRTHTDRHGEHYRFECKPTDSDVTVLAWSELVFGGMLPVTSQATL